jgi:hypothetical protein
MKYSICSAIFLNKIGSGLHKEAQNSVGEGEVLVISMPGKKKVPEHHSDLRPAQKELPERCSGMFRHKYTPDYMQ